MKELSIEQKAKVYDKFVEELKSKFKDFQVIIYSKNDLEKFFSELKESEDEKVRKAIIWCIDTVVGELGINEAEGLPISKLKSWLKKQGEQKPLWHNEDEEPQRGSLILLIMQSGKPIVAKIIEPNHTFNHGERWAYIDDLLEKQDEQKPVDKDETTDYNSIDPHFGKPIDKVEPKFHKGEWLCENESNNYDRFIQILEIVNVQGKGKYKISRDIHKDEDVVEFGFVEKYYHKFDIQDAKDGDVLVCETDEVEWIFIYREIVPAAQEVPHDLLRYYFLLEGNYSNWNGVSAMVTDDYELYLKPATKEQRDLLFQKMKEAGYEWDAKKKELKKIEQKPQRMVSAEAKEALYGKSAWSEEDDSCLSTIIAEFSKCAGKSVSKDEWMRCNDFLNSLKDRILPKSTWSKEDESNIQNIDSVLFYDKNLPEDTCMRLRNWLESLKNRVQPETVKWSEEDDQYLLVCKNALAKYQTTDKWDACIISNWLENKLKSLKPQPKHEWSEEDGEIIEALNDYVKNLDILFSEIKIGNKDILSKEFREKVQHWLKSLRPQNKTYYWTENEIKFAISDYIRGVESYEKMVEKLRCLKPHSQWKPSKEQMKAIKDAIEFLGCTKKVREDLKSLYEQLLKLREEDV